MSVIRQDATTKAWVIIATERATRPDDFEGAMPARASPEHEASCPFCPGYEMSTPPELWRLSDPQGSGWAVRVIPNKFAALAGTGEPHRREAGPLFREMDGIGAHEVIIETPVHNRVMPLMTDAEIELVLQAYQARSGRFAPTRACATSSSSRTMVNGQGRPSSTHTRSSSPLLSHHSRFGARMRWRSGTTMIQDGACMPT